MQCRTKQNHGTHNHPASNYHSRCGAFLNHPDRTALARIRPVLVATIIQYCGILQQHCTRAHTHARTRTTTNVIVFNQHPANLFRPLALRRANTLRPPTDLMRVKSPVLRRLRRIDGWKVRLMSQIAAEDRSDAKDVVIVVVGRYDERDLASDLGGASMVIVEKQECNTFRGLDAGPWWSTSGPCGTCTTHGVATATNRRAELRVNNQRLIVLVDTRTVKRYSTIVLQVCHTVIRSTSILKAAAYRPSRRRPSSGSIYEPMDQ